MTPAYFILFYTFKHSWKVSLDLLWAKATILIVTSSTFAFLTWTEMMILPNKLSLNLLYRKLLWNIDAEPFIVIKNSVELPAFNVAEY